MLQQDLTGGARYLRFFGAGFIEPRLAQVDCELKKNTHPIMHTQMFHVKHCLNIDSNRLQASCTEPHRAALTAPTHVIPAAPLGLLIHSVALVEVQATHHVTS